MRTVRWHLRFAATAALLAALAPPAQAVLYEFRINDGVGVGDPALSQAVAGASGDIYVLVPLQSLAVPGFPGVAPTLVFHGPPAGVVLTTPNPEYDINFGGGLPACPPGGGPCATPLGVEYVSLVELTSDIWGRFAGGTGAGPLVWIPNPDPGAHSFNVFAQPGVVVPFPGSFSMMPVIPEPPVTLLFGLALTALVLRRRSRRDAARGVPA